MATSLNYKLAGTCNRCGNCCTDGPYRCSNLAVTKKLGEPEATVCKVHSTRYDQMPIILGVNIGCCGIVIMTSWCAKDSDAEVKAIVEKGINRGCSLKVVARKSKAPALTTFTAHV